MKRHTCICYRKKRNEEFMQKVDVLRSEAYDYGTTKHWVCIECIPNYKKRLVALVSHLNVIYNSLSSGVDVKEKAL